MSVRVGSKSDIAAHGLHEMTGIKMPVNVTKKSALSGEQGAISVN